MSTHMYLQCPSVVKQRQILAISVLVLRSVEGIPFKLCEHACKL
jgi:hypothetical protein